MHGMSFREDELSPMARDLMSLSAAIEEMEMETEAEPEPEAAAAQPSRRSGSGETSSSARACPPATAAPAGEAASGDDFPDRSRKAALLRVLWAFLCVCPCFDIVGDLMSVANYVARGWRAVLRFAPPRLASPVLTGSRHGIVPRTAG